MYIINHGKVEVSSASLDAQVSISFEKRTVCICQNYLFHKSLYLFQYFLLRWLFVTRAVVILLWSHHSQMGTTSVKLVY